MIHIYTPEQAIALIGFMVLVGTVIFKIIKPYIVK